MSPWMYSPEMKRVGNQLTTTFVRTDDSYGCWKLLPDQVTLPRRRSTKEKHGVTESKIREHYTDLKKIDTLNVANAQFAAKYLNYFVRTI